MKKLVILLSLLIIPVVFAISIMNSTEDVNGEVINSINYVCNCLCRENKEGIYCKVNINYSINDTVIWL